MTNDGLRHIIFSFPWEKGAQDDVSMGVVCPWISSKIA